MAKKFKKLNETLSLKLQDLQKKNETLTAKIELSFNSQQMSTDQMKVMPIAQNKALSAVGGHHQMGGKQKYNSIDIAYDESNFENMKHKNARTNTNISSSQKKILQSDVNVNHIYQTASRSNHGKRGVITNYQIPVSSQMVPNQLNNLFPSQQRSSSKNSNQDKMVNRKSSRFQKGKFNPHSESTGIEIQFSGGRGSQASTLVAQNSSI